MPSKPTLPGYLTDPERERLLAPLDGFELFPYDPLARPFVIHLERVQLGGLALEVFNYTMSPAGKADGTSWGGGLVCRVVHASVEGKVWPHVRVVPRCWSQRLVKLFEPKRSTGDGAFDRAYMVLGPEGCQRMLTPPARRALLECDKPPRLELRGQELVLMEEGYVEPGGQRDFAERVVGVFEGMVGAPRGERRPSQPNPTVGSGTK